MSITKSIKIDQTTFSSECLLLSHTDNLVTFADKWSQYFDIEIDNIDIKYWNMDTDFQYCRYRFSQRMGKTENKILTFLCFYFLLNYKIYNILLN